MSAPRRFASRGATEIVRELRAAGVTVDVAGRGHLRARHSSGAVLIFAHTPRSWHHERRKVRGWLRRADAGQATVTTRSGRRAGDGAPAHAALACTYVTTGL